MDLLFNVLVNNERVNQRPLEWPEVQTLWYLLEQEGERNIRIMPLNANNYRN